MKVLLDSTEFVDYLRSSASTIAVLRDLLVAGHELVTSSINVGEVYSGIRPKELRRLEELLAEIEVYSVTYEIGKHAGELRNSAARKGRTVFLPDMIVAATCLAQGCVLLTGNRKDFVKVEGLRLFDPEQ